MNCDSVRDEISAYLDGELTPEVRGQLEAHVDTCPECRRVLERFKQVDTLYAALPRVAAPVELEDRLRGQIASMGKVRRFGRSRLAWSTFAAAAGVIIMLGAAIQWMYRTPQGLGEFTMATMEAPERVSESAPAGTAGIADEHDAAMGRAGGGGAMAPKASPLAGEGGAMASDPADTRNLAARRPAEAPATPLQSIGYLDDDTPDHDSSVAEPTTQLGYQADGVASSPAEKPRALAAPPAPSPALRGETLETIAGDTATEALRFRREPMPEHADEKAEKGAPLAAPPEADVSRWFFAEAESDRDSDAHQGVRDNGGAVPEARSQPLPPAPAELPSVEAEVPQRAPRAPGEMAVVTATRTLRYRDNVWTQVGYEDESTKKLARDSRAWRDLIEREPALADFASLEAAVVFRAFDTWYRLEALKQP